MFFRFVPLISFCHDELFEGADRDSRLSSLSYYWQWISGIAEYVYIKIILLSVKPFAHQTFGETL